MKLNVKISAAVVLSAAILMVGCKVGPNYKKPPEMSLPDRYLESTTQPSTRAASQPSAELNVWWESFNDPMLTSLIDRSVQSNFTLREAMLRVAQARAQRGVVAADWWPDVNVDGSATRNRRSDISSNNSSSNNNNGNSNIGSNGNRLSSRWGNVWQAGFDASWELDVFGGTARNVEAANADIQAAVEDQRDTLVTLLSEVARSYIDLRGSQHDLTITQNNLKSQQETLDLTRKRFNAGISSDLDVAQAEAQVETTQAAIPTLQTQVRQDIYALSVLCGQAPEALSDELTPEKDMPRNWPTVPLGLPSELLRRRPDIRRAERQLAAATARVGVATADLFPKFSLTGSYGWDATKTAHLFNDSNNSIGIGPSVTWPIFDAGRIRSNISVQNALQGQAAAVYSQAVLTALQDVESSLVAYHREQDRRIALAQAVSSDRRAFDLSSQLYSRGLVDFLSVLDSERALYQAEDLLVRSDIAVSEDLIALYKALGGGWE